MNTPNPSPYFAPFHPQMPAICRAIMARSQDLGLKGASKTRDQEACMQGALAALTAAGLMPHERAQMVGFLCTVGRLPAFITKQAEIDPPAA